MDDLFANYHKIRELGRFVKRKCVTEVRIDQLKKFHKLNGVRNH